MPIDSVTLPPNIMKIAERLLASIESADSMLQGVKVGARAEGFVLGLETACCIEAEQIETLYVLFDEATSSRLTELAG
jgi:hypothetical protein